MSMENRDFISDLTSRSYASLTFWMGMISTSAVTNHTDFLSIEITPAAHWGVRCYPGAE